MEVIFVAHLHETKSASTTGRSARSRTPKQNVCRRRCCWKHRREDIDLPWSPLAFCSTSSRPGEHLYHSPSFSSASYPLQTRLGSTASAVPVLKIHHLEGQQLRRSRVVRLRKSFQRPNPCLIMSQRKTRKLVKAKPVNKVVL